MQTIVVWFSCGAASAVAAKKTIERYGCNYVIRVVNNPVKEERPDNRRFLHDVEKWIGRKIEIAINGNYPNCSAEEVWIDRQYISGPKGAPCTVELKKEARYQYELRNKIDYHVLGFTAEEQVRFDRFVLGERANTLPVLIDAGLTKQDCYDLLISEGIKPPDAYALGYNNANCEGCVKASSATYWNHVRKTSPEVFKARAELSRKIGAKLVRWNGKRMFLDELPPDAVGRPMKTLHVECGIFCDTN
jgi:hypothetical protein